MMLMVTARSPIMAKIKTIKLQLILDQSLTSHLSYPSSATAYHTGCILSSQGLPSRREQRPSSTFSPNIAPPPLAIRPLPVVPTHPQTPILLTRQIRTIRIITDVMSKHHESSTGISPVSFKPALSRSFKKDYSREIVSFHPPWGVFSSAFIIAYLFHKKRASSSSPRSSTTSAQCHQLSSSSCYSDNVPLSPSLPILTPSSSTSPSTLLSKIVHRLKKSFLYLFKAIQLSLLSLPLLFLGPPIYLLEYLQRNQGQHLDFLRQTADTLHDILWQYVYFAAENAGPCYIKFLQWAGSRPDLFSASVCQRCMRMHRDVKKHSFKDTVKILNAAFGKHWNGVLDIDPHPLGSGCIAQVYRGRIKMKVSGIRGGRKGRGPISHDADDDEMRCPPTSRGHSNRSRRHSFSSSFRSAPSSSTSDIPSSRAFDPEEYYEVFELSKDPSSPPIVYRSMEVAIKITHPNITNKIEVDLFLISTAVAFLQIVAPSFVKWLGIELAVNHFAAAMQSQTDMRMEAMHTKRFRKLFGVRGDDFSDYDDGGNDPDWGKGGGEVFSRAPGQPQPAPPPPWKRKLKKLFTNIFSLAQSANDRITFPAVLDGWVASEVLVEELKRGVHVASWMATVKEATGAYREDDAVEQLAFKEGRKNWRTSDIAIGSFASTSGSPFDDELGLVQSEKLAKGVEEKNITEEYNTYVNLSRGKGEELLQRVARIGIHSFLKMLFVDNFIHADLHPGNILIEDDRDGDSLSVTFLDCGLVTALNRRDRRNFLALFSAVSQGDGRKVGHLILQEAQKEQCEQPQEFIDEITTIVDTFLNADVLSGRAGTILSRVLSAACRHKVQLETNFVNLCMAVLILEGLGRQLHPELNLMRTAVPYVMQALLTSL